VSPWDHSGLMLAHQLTSSQMSSRAGARRNRQRRHAPGRAESGQGATTMTLGRAPCGATRGKEDESERGEHDGQGDRHRRRQGNELLNWTSAW
jgi:hypothetical protein